MVHHGVSGIEVIYSSDYKEGFDRISFLGASHDELTSIDMRAHLEGLKVRMSANYSPSFWEMLVSRLGEDAESLLEQSEPESGTLMMRIALDCYGAHVAEKTYTKTPCPTL
jgi:hypothetical protein